jgi:ubiquitin carboxyl-terminal hydrolase 16/45
MAMTPESDEDTIEQKKPKTVYSNASKQLLIFCPPAVLTIHLKRFQHTMSNLRKVNKHVQFPLTLDLAPFCSSTSLSMPTVQAGVSEIQYTLFGLVEHSGRLQSGHYTAYVKIRPTTNVNKNDFAKEFYSSPTARNEEIHTLLAEIEKKTREAAATAAAANIDDNKVSAESVCVDNPGGGKWFYISDSSVTEVSEEKVLKCQAYLLFYERIN